MSEKAHPERTREPYRRFAEIYDRVMRDVGYEMWTDYILRILHRLGANPRTMLDLACGTGNTSLPFARRGFAVTGVDRSPDMLRRAAAKARLEGLPVHWVEQDLRALSLRGTWDLAICLYDSVNYILEWDEVVRVFTNTLAALRPGGLFIFDINTASKLAAAHDTTLFIEEEGVALVWENSWDRVSRVWQVALTGFLEGGDGRWERFKELHREKAYTLDQIEEALAKAGFEQVAAYTAFTFEPAREESSRVYFVCRRPGGR